MNSRAIYSAEPARGWLPWGALAPFLAVVLVAAPALALSEVMERLQLYTARGYPIGRAGLLALLFIDFSLMGLVLLAWVRFVERRPLATIGLVGPERTKTFLRGHLVGLATISSVVAAIWLAGGAEAGAVGKILRSPTDLLYLALLLAGFALQSSVEEIFFRGWLLSGIARKFNVAAAVVLTSIVFAFLHYGPGRPWLDTLNTFLFSAFACFWALGARNIWSVMGWHAGWNWLLAVGFELPVTGLDAKVSALLVQLTPHGPAYLTGGSQGPEGSYFCTLFFVLGIAFLAWRFRGAREPSSPMSLSAPMPSSSPIGEGSP